jgi:hypothetical protein
VITPNKVIPLDESALGGLSAILSQGPHSRDLVSLYNDVAGRFESIDQFLLTLDVLYVLGRIDIDEIERTVSYAR